MYFFLKMYFFLLVLFSIIYLWQMSVHQPVQANPKGATQWREEKRDQPVRWGRREGDIRAWPSSCHCSARSNAVYFLLPISFSPGTEVHRGVHRRAGVQAQRQYYARNTGKEISTAETVLAWNVFWQLIKNNPNIWPDFWQLIKSNIIWGTWGPWALVLAAASSQQSKKRQAKGKSRQPPIFGH